MEWEPVFFRDAVLAFPARVLLALAAGVRLAFVARILLAVSRLLFFVAGLVRLIALPRFCFPRVVARVMRLAM
jgi:hypothetical protein